MTTLPPDRLAEILELVGSSLDRPELSGSQIADQAYLSRFHLDRLVAAALGEPPGAFRHRILLERAAHRLASTGDAVIDVAFAAGYGSPEAFARAFGRAFHTPPSTFRRRGGIQYQLPAANHIHFHPPGGLRLPSLHRSTAMDVLVRMLDHHLSVTGKIIDRTAALPDATLDRPLLTVDGIDNPPTLLATTERLVSQLEMWITALEGGSAVAANPDTSPAGQKRRLASAAPRFRELVLDPIQQGRAGDTFIDAICDPPQTFSYGGVLAHVLTFSAARRTLAIGALESAGVNDLGSGDPMQFVGGTGADAALITRNH